MEKSKFNDVSNEKLICTFNYMKNANNWINEKTGELFVTDEMIKKFPEEMKEHKNYLILKKYFKNIAPQIPPKFSIKFGKQENIF